MPNPWDYADNTNNEYAHQVALFMWANMARLFGSAVADDRRSYMQDGFAKAMYEDGSARWGGSLPQFKPLADLEWLHAIKNQGHGDVVRGSRSKAEGVRSGVFDTFLPVPRTFNQDYYASDGPFVGAYPLVLPGETSGVFCAYHGFYLELKRPKSARGAAGKEREDQAKFQHYARVKGYAAEIVVGWLDARKLLLQYLGVTPPE